MPKKVLECKHQMQRYTNLIIEEANEITQIKKSL